jgi:hypothetical protein
MTGGPDTELEADETFIGGLTKHKGRKLRLVPQGGMHGVKPIVQESFTGIRVRFVLKLYRA